MNYVKFINFGNHITLGAGTRGPIFVLNHVWLKVNAKNPGAEPGKDPHIILVSEAKPSETDVAGADLDPNNEDEKEEEKATDMSVPETCTESELNKMDDKQAESIIDFDDKSDVGKTNIEADEADKLESNIAAKADNTAFT